jgi:hypothetical protein
MSNSTGSDYIMQNAILKEAAKSEATGTNMSIEKPAVDYAAGKSASDADTLRFSSDLNFKKQQTAQSEKQFLTQLLFAHDQLETWSKQNDLATLLSVAAIPGQLISMNNQSESLKKQDAMNKEIMDIYKGIATAKAAAVASDTSDFNSWKAAGQTPAELPALLKLRDVAPAGFAGSKNYAPKTIIPNINLRGN